MRQKATPVSLNKFGKVFDCEVKSEHVIEMQLLGNKAQLKPSLPLESGKIDVKVLNVRILLHLDSGIETIDADVDAVDET